MRFVEPDGIPAPIYRGNRRPSRHDMPGRSHHLLSSIMPSMNPLLFLLFNSISRFIAELLSGYSSWCTSSHGLPDFVDFE